MNVELQSSALRARLDALADEAEGDAVLAFDADGTLWQGDVTRDLVAFVMNERPLLPDALPRLSAIAATHGVYVGSDVHEQLAALVLSYSIGTLPELAAVESVAIAFAGHDEHTFDDFVAQAIDRANLASRFHAVVEPIFAWAERRGVPIVVVSASPRTAVTHALTKVGLSANAVLGAATRIVRGRLAPELEHPVLVGSAKVDALRAHTEATVLAAFGDDVRDLPLLRTSRLAVAVHPTEELLARGAQTGGLHVLLHSP